MIASISIADTIYFIDSTTQKVAKGWVDNYDYSTGKVWVKTSFLKASKEMKRYEIFGIGDLKKVIEERIKKGL